MTQRFNDFINFVLAHEGGAYENDPDDPGGPTRWGIDHRSHPDVDIKNLTKDEATQIYFDSYWTPNRCETLPRGIGESHMDACVNCGSGRAKRFLAAANGSPSEYNNQRSAFYKRLVEARPSSAKYLRGWENRVQDLRKWIGIT